MYCIGADVLVLMYWCWCIVLVLMYWCWCIGTDVLLMSLLKEIPYSAFSRFLLWFLACSIM